MLTVDQETTHKVETVLDSLRRFDRRLAVAITPPHYSDLVGDNWTNVREFAESPQGRSVPELAALLVEIIILYRQAEEMLWVPKNLERVERWWGEASEKRRWLSDIVEAARIPRPHISEAASRKSKYQRRLQSPNCTLSGQWPLGKRPKLHFQDYHHPRRRTCQQRKAA